jgi:hypothetical protein
MVKKLALTGNKKKTYSFGSEASCLGVGFVAAAFYFSFQEHKLFF